MLAERYGEHIHCFTPPQLFVTLVSGEESSSILFTLLDYVVKNVFITDKVAK
jgi:hypothetical protein